MLFELGKEFRAHHRDIRFRIQEPTHLLGCDVSAANDDHAPALRFHEDGIQRHVTPLASTQPPPCPDDS